MLTALCHYIIVSQTELEFVYFCYNYPLNVYEETPIKYKTLLLFYNKYYKVEGKKRRLIAASMCNPLEIILLRFTRN
jgi:hypothetical protein